MNIAAPQELTATQYLLPTIRGERHDCLAMTEPTAGSFDGRRFGGSAAHQKSMMGNLVCSLIAAEGIVTTEAKAKALRPIAEKLITKAKKGGVHRHRQVVSFMGDKEMASKLFSDIAPRYEGRPGGYIRILKLGPRQGDNASMARIELV